MKGVKQAKIITDDYGEEYDKLLRSLLTVELSF